MFAVPGFPALSVVEVAPELYSRSITHVVRGGEPARGKAGLTWLKDRPSETGRRVRFYRLTPAGAKRLKQELKEYGQATAAIQAILMLA